MKNLICIFTFLLSAFYGAQEKDSLENALKAEKNPDKKAALYLSLVTHYSETDSGKALKYLDYAEDLTKNSKPAQKAAVLNSRAFYNLRRDQQKALGYYDQALKIVQVDQSAEALKIRAKLWYNKAALAQNTGNSKEALEIAMKEGLEHAKKVPEEIYTINNYLLIGLIFYNENNLDKALQYLHSAEKELKQRKYSKETKKFETVTQIYLSETYLKQRDFPKVKKHIDIAESLLKKYPNYDIEGDLYHMQSLYYHFVDQPKKALEKAEKGLKNAENYKNGYQFVRLSFVKAKILPALGRYDEAISTIKNLMNNEMYVQVFGRNRATIFEELSWIEEQRGDYKAALAYANQRIEVLDSVNSESQNAVINELETKYRTADKEKQLAQQELEISNKNKYMWILGLISLLFLSSAVFFYKNFKNKKKIAEQREINLQQKLREKEQQEELKVTKAILDGEERERERVAKDLHDGLGGMLAGVKINLSSWSSHHLEENQISSFHKILNQLDSSVSELRRVARNLMPESLLNFGLEVALKDLCEFYMRDDLCIEFQGINIKNNLPLNLQINIYRIVQELLANAVKHSAATNILVQCSQSENQFYITVEDNGKGIRSEDMNKTKSLGLQNLKNRVNYLKGKIEIQTEEKEGTSINVEIKTNAVA